MSPLLPRGGAPLPGATLLLQPRRGGLDDFLQPPGGPAIDPQPGAAIFGAPQAEAAPGVGDVGGGFVLHPVDPAPLRRSDAKQKTEYIEPAVVEGADGPLLSNLRHGNWRPAMGGRVKDGKHVGGGAPKAPPKNLITQVLEKNDGARVIWEAATKGKSGGRVDELSLEAEELALAKHQSNKARGRPSTVDRCLRSAIVKIANRELGFGSGRSKSEPPRKR